MVAGKPKVKRLSMLFADSSKISAYEGKPLAMIKDSDSDLLTPPCHQWYQTDTVRIVVKATSAYN